MVTKETKQTASEYKVAIALKELSNGINGCFGGDKINTWLTQNLETVEDIVVSTDRISIQFNPAFREKVSEFIKFLEKEHIGDEKWWSHTSDDKWYLIIWFD